MAKKHKWTKAQRAAASKRMKERYAKKREQEVPGNEPPLKLEGLMHRLTVLQDDAQGLADDIEGIKEALENL